MKATNLFALFTTGLLSLSAQASLTVFGDNFEYAVLTDDSVQPSVLGPWSVVGSTRYGIFNPSGAGGSTWYEGISGLTDTNGGVVGDMDGITLGYIFNINGNSDVGVQRDIGTIDANTIYEATIALSGNRTNGEPPSGSYSIDLISGSTVLQSTTGSAAGMLFENITPLSWDSSSLPVGVSLGDTLTFRITVDDTTGGYLDFDNLVLSETIVPEPSAAILLSLSGLGLLLRRRRL